MKKRFIRALAVTMVMNTLVMSTSYAAPDADAIKEEKEAAEAAVSSLQNQIVEVVKEINELEEQLIVKGEEILVATEELAIAEKLEKEQYEAMKLRIKYMYENGNENFLDLLLSSDNMEDFLNKAEYVEKITEYDRNMLDLYAKTREDIAVYKEQLLDEKTELELLIELTEAEYANMELLIASKEEELNKYDANIADNEALQEELDAEWDDMNDDLKALEAQLKKEEEEAKKKKVIYDGKDERTCVLNNVLTKYGQIMAIVNNDYWRCTRFIEEGITYEQTNDPKIFEEAGVAVGQFQRHVDSLNSRLLVDTIKHFHDTPYRYNYFLDIVKIDRVNRAKNCKKEIEYINNNRHLLKNRPNTFQHGDYHVGNMMINKDKELVIIDFDRSDYGDPWEEFNRLVWSIQVSHEFATGIVDGYFNKKVPVEFWELLALYMCLNSLSSLPWAIPYGEGEVKIMINQSNEILDWYDDMKSYVPKWYK